MGNASKTAVAAEKAVAKSQKKAEVTFTPAQSIAIIRNHLAAGLYTPAHHIATLLAEYDRLNAADTSRFRHPSAEQIVEA